MSTNITLSIIVPCYHVGDSLGKLLKKKIAVLDTLEINYELIVVLDGADHKAERAYAELLHNYESSWGDIKQIIFAKNSGKGNAVRAGMAVAQGEYIGYMDADNDIDPVILSEMYYLISDEQKKLDAVIPSKRHQKSQVKTPFLRHLYSNIYNIYVRLVIGLPVSDTQLGAKLYRATALKPILEQCHLQGFVFEVEMLDRLRQAGFDHWQETPVVLNLATKTTINSNNARNIMKESLQFTWEHFKHK